MARNKRPIQKICCIGEVMIEIVSDDGVNAKLGVAGDTFNTAVYLSRILADTDVSVAYCTALGSDLYSQIIMKSISAHGIGTSSIEIRDDKNPGLYAIDTDENGERSFTYWRSDSAARTLFQAPCSVPLEELTGYDLLYLSGISLAILTPEVRRNLLHFVSGFCKGGGTVAFDSNYRPRLWESTKAARELNREMWRLTDIALPSLDDEIELFGDRNETDVLRRLGSLGVEFGALKRGALGPINLTTCQKAQGLPTVAEVVDSTAAGDSFNAGFLAAHVKSKDVRECLKAGHNLAAEVIKWNGAITPIQCI
ncbi:sugar kinase [Ruegeria meonggei]|uniref:2-dehydro-3-deoxygluconokinase n=1 Tax=Ruegeria meonggei TaxID=1446476 RepID=A0A1X6ZLM8_9RHOB|nr:sugar kinase [Ruegeria meonggei]SLN52991.1 2-dehydro-3-deoxygluconokinase [Ruegeria meonggei]